MKVQGLCRKQHAFVIMNTLMRSAGWKRLCPFVFHLLVHGLIFLLFHFVTTSISFSFIYIYLKSALCLFLHLRYNSRLSILQPPRVSYLPIMLWLVERRVHHLLWERRGHGPLRLRTHVSLLRLWPQTQEDGKRLLPHLQEDNQGHHKNLPKYVGLK